MRECWNQQQTLHLGRACWEKTSASPEAQELQKAYRDLGPYKAQRSGQRLDGNMRLPSCPAQVLPRRSLFSTSTMLLSAMSFYGFCVSLCSGPLVSIVEARKAHLHRRNLRMP